MEQMRSSVAGVPVLVVALVCGFGLAACGADGSPAPPTAASTSATPAVSSTAPEASPLEGAWGSHLTPERITAHLKKAGLGRWAEEFLVTERTPSGEQTAVYTFDGDLFQVAYHNSDGTWQVGWKGALEITGDTVSLRDDFSQITDTFRWRVDGHALSLDGSERRRGLQGNANRGGPDAAYLTDPLIRTECAMEPNEDRRGHGLPSPPTARSALGPSPSRPVTNDRSEITPCNPATADALPQSFAPDAARHRVGSRASRPELVAGALTRLAGHLTVTSRQSRVPGR